MGRGVFVSRSEGERTTLRDALNRYLSSVTGKKRGAAQERSVIQHLLAEPIARASLARVRSSDIASLAGTWSRAGLAPATVNRRLAVLSPPV